MNWNSIDTAPKDGTRIILFGYSNGYFASHPEYDGPIFVPLKGDESENAIKKFPITIIAHWVEEKRYEYTEVQPGLYTKKQIIGWSGWNRYGVSESFNPTHWMTLPDSPTKRVYSYTGEHGETIMWPSNEFHYE